MTTFNDAVFALGGVPTFAGLPFSQKSQYFFVDPARGSSTGRGTMEDPCNSIETAEALCTANQHDTVVYISGATADNLTAALTWDKSYTHLIGICAPTGVGQRSRIFQTSTLTGASPLITVSGSGCIFKNLYIFQGVNDNTSLINVSVTGERNYFENVHFAGGGHASHAINNGMSLKIDAGAENRFVGCTIGVDTIGGATGFVGLAFDGGARRNVFERCTVRMEAAHIDAAFIEVIDATAIDHDNLFVDCIFTNNSSTITMATAVLSAAVSTGGRLLFKDCMFNKVTKVDASDRTVVYGNMNAVTAADLAGVAVQLVV
jgi:hypothetical protein